MEDNEMDVEEIREGVLAILKELHEDIDFEAEDKMVEAVAVQIVHHKAAVPALHTAKDFIAENFNSVDSLADMIARLLEE